MSGLVKAPGDKASLTNCFGTKNRLDVGEDATRFKVREYIDQRCCQVLPVGHGQHDRISLAGQAFPRRQMDAVLMHSFRIVGHRVMRDYIETKSLKIGHQVSHLGIPQVGAVFLECQAQDDHCGTFAASPSLDHVLYRLLGNVTCHPIIDAPSGKDYLRVVAKHFGLVG